MRVPPAQLTRIPISRFEKTQLLRFGFGLRRTGEDSR